MRLALVFFIPLLQASEICKVGKKYKHDHVICGHFNVTPGWERQLPSKLDRLTFKDVTGNLDLTNLTLPIRYLVVTHSKITNFALGKFPNLVFLTLARNDEFPEISQELFSGTTNLSWVSLISNNHTIVPGAFSPLKNLTWVHVQNQKLVTLSRDFFHDNTKLHELSLRNCDLQGVELGAFDKMSGLEILGLNFNKLTHFVEGTFRRLGALKILELHHNQFVEFNLEQFSGLVALEVLGLPSNFWRHVEVDNLKTVFPKLKKVEMKKHVVKNGEVQGVVRKLREEGIQIIGTPYDFRNTT